MKTRLVIASWSVMVLGLLAPLSSFAHEYKSNGTIGVLLHVEPGDKPVAKGKSSLYFYISDKNNVFTSAGCDCQLTVSLNGKVTMSRGLFSGGEINTQPGGSNAQIPIVFPRAGVYDIHVTGKPRSPGAFAAFDFEYQQRVEVNANSLAGVNWVLVAGILLIAVMGWLAYRHGRSVRWRQIPVHARRHILRLRYWPTWMVTIIGFVVMYCVGLVIGYWVGGGSSISTGSATDPHAQHVQLAQQGGVGAANSTLGLSGDATKRYTVSFLHDDAIAAGQDTTLQFKVYDANTGSPATVFTPVWTQLMHLVIVDDQLQYFDHIHPTLTDGVFSITTQFPHDGEYHLYIDFLPNGAIEQQMGFSLKVGSGEAAVAAQSVDQTLTKSFGQYKVSISTNQLDAAKLTTGQQKLSFTFKDASTGKPIIDLKPYLGAFGHLVMINEATYDYIHVHPTNKTAPAPDANSGPIVDFQPLGLYGPIKPGIYRVFAQFNPAGTLMVADFTVQVK